MKKLLLLISFMSIASFINSQYSWKICLNKKTVLVSNESNELLNTKIIKSTDWMKNGYLEISFKEKTPSNWRHSFQFSDELGNLILTKDSVTFIKFPNAELRKLFAGKKQVIIHMIINPPNPMMMAPSRMIHLGTLRLP